ncbi:MAG: inositol monophosphatase [Chloroflexi bacterium]|nr:inositol monophosphatase [Chloroflexota bacterium]
MIFDFVMPLSVTGRPALEVARLACHKAGSALLDHFRTVNHVRHKGKRDICTEADLLSEGIIKDILHSEFPDDGIITEESPAQSGKSGYKWIIDPLDGTNNYFYGLPYFAVNIALVVEGRNPSFPRRRESTGEGEDGSKLNSPKGPNELKERGEEVVLGLTYAPVQRELFRAEKGKGAFLNDAPVHISGAAQLKDCLVGFDMGYNEEEGHRMLDVARSVWPRVHTIRLLGSGALGLAYVACGRLGLYFHRHLYPWDIASGILLVQEAGGVVEAWGGKPIRTGSGSVVAGPAGLLDEFHAAT